MFDTFAHTNGTNPPTMGISERKARDKQDLRNLILDGAMALFAAKGVTNVTIRNIADAIEYSTGTVYVYFKDKNDILHALHSKGFIELKKRFMVLQNVANPMERLKAMGRVYLQFAQEYPDMYNLMFTYQAPLEHVDEWQDEKEWHEGKSAFGFLRHLIDECMAQGHFVGHEPEALAFMIWSMVHGMCTLVISRRSQVVDLTHPTQQGYAEFERILTKL